MDRIDDSKWPEVEMINGSTTFMGLLMLAVRGLAVLIIAWITVVLLGGFVSNLEKKDFWCLTMIALVQTAGVFNSLVEEKAGDIVNSFGASILAFAAVALSMRPLHNCIEVYAQGASNICLLIAWKALSAAVGVVWFLLYVASIFLAMAHWVVLGIIYCPIAALYLFGIYVSTGISIWRLKHQDYGNGKPNLLKPSLNIVYVLAAAQGVCYCYKALHKFALRAGLAEEVAKKYGLDPGLVSLYMKETIEGCMKDSSFARGRNLVTCGVDLLLESRSLDDRFSSGVQILAKTTRLQHRVRLLTALPSFKEVVQRLLEALDSRRGYGLVTRKHAATVVENVAHRICLDQFPGGVRFISSLLSHDHEHSIPRDIDEYQCLTEIVLCILEKLALYDDNCIIIRNTEGVLSKIMGPLISEQLHGVVRHNNEWCRMAKRRMELMRRIMGPPGEAGISSSNMATISNLKSIVECRHGCEVALKIEAVELLLHLPADRSSIMINRSSSRILYLGILVHIFLVADGCSGDDTAPGSNYSVRKGSDVRRLAGEHMQTVLTESTIPQSGPAATRRMLESVRFVISSLARTVVEAGSSTHRVHAAQILTRLCDDYHTAALDEYLDELAKAVVDLMSKVLLSLKVQRLAPDVDIEKGAVLPPSNNGQAKASSSQHQQHQNGDDESELQEALIVLCKKARSRWVRRNRDFNRWLDEITAKTCSDQGIIPAIKTFYDLVSDTEIHLKKAQRLVTQATLSG